MNSCTGNRQATAANKPSGLGIGKPSVSKCGPRPVRVKNITTGTLRSASDPNETRNLASQHPEIVRQLEAVFKREHVPSQLFPLPGVDSIAPAAP